VKFLGQDTEKVIESEDSPLDLSAIVASSSDDGQSESEEVETSENDGIILGKEDDEVYLGGMDEMPGDNNLSREAYVVEEVVGDEPVEIEEVTVAPVSDPEGQGDTKPARRTDAKKYRMRMLVMEGHESIRKFIVKLFSHEGFKVRGVATREEAIEEMEHGEYDSLVIKDKDLGEGEEFVNLVIEKFPDVELCSIKDYGSAVIGETRLQKRLMASFLETLDVIMGLLEMETKQMQGHSHNAGKYARLIANKLDLPQREIDTIAIAAYVHELGRKGMPHRSVLRLDAVESPEDLVEQGEIPLKLLSAAKIPLDIKPILHHQFEKWDGSGIPDSLKGEDIPIGSRVMAIVEAFEDLTNNKEEDEPIERTAALETLKKMEGSAFDPELMEVFLGVVRDDIYIQQMAGEAERIMIVDTEVDIVTLLELRLANMGFAMTTVKLGEDAIEKAVNEAPSLIITETDLPDMSGFDMIEKIKAEAATAEVPFLFLSKNDDPSAVNKAFDLGAEDYISKPVKVDVLGAKINTMMARFTAEKKKAAPSAGVSGSLSEMGIPDIVQILNAGRKTGRITLEDDSKSCYIDMEDGQVVNASIDDLKGEDAFYKILYWTQGTFSIDSSAEISDPLISLSMDSLMLEGFRRMDEESHQGGGEEDITLDGSDFF